MRRNLETKNLQSTREICNVIFQPSGRLVLVSKGATLRDAISKAKLVIEYPCGGKGICGKCLIKIIRGSISPTDSDKRIFTPQELKDGYRLACLAKVQGDLEVLICSSPIPQIKKASSKKVAIPCHPDIKKVFVKLEKPSLNYPISYEENIKNSVGRLVGEPYLNLDSLIEIPDAISPPNYEITAVLENNKIIHVTSGIRDQKLFGVALDIGTTTVAGCLIDLVSGEEVATSYETNVQIKYGGDVISRINFSNSKGKEGLVKLQNEIMRVVNIIITKMAKFAGIDKRDIYEMVVVGNSTMTHLFAGISPKSLGSIPFIPVFKDGMILRSKELGIDIFHGGVIYIAPNIGGFIGSDTLGVILALQLHTSKGVELAIDLGTNGQVVLKTPAKMIAASTAAGPAFEGVGLSSGTRAIPGAIESFRINNDGKICYNTIANKEALGICGSGLIDVIAELVKSKIIDRSGAFMGSQRSQEFPKGCEEINGEMGFIVAETKDKKIAITQKDIRKIQLAKAAIRSGIEILKKEQGCDNHQIDNLFIAGTFGNSINKENAKIVGIIPDVPSEKIEFVGNSALEGAKMILISAKMKAVARDISYSTRHIELSTRSDFQDKFVEYMGF